MRGHIAKRYKNSYTIVLNLGKDPATGKRKQQWVSIKGTKKDAEKRLAELLNQVDTGTFIKPTKTTLAEFLKRWLKDYVSTNLAPRTAEGYDTIIRQHLIPELGRLTLTQLRPEHLQKYYSDMLNNGQCDCSGALSAQTVRHHHTCLHKALQTAIEWGLLSRNIADAVKPPKAQTKEMRIWDADEISHFLEAAKCTLYYALFYTALFTGMRRSELLALRWQDVDLVFGQISVSRSLHQLRDKSIVYRPTKTAKAKRTVALPPSALSVLTEHRKVKEAESLLLAITLTDDALVFSTPEGKPLRPNTVTRAWTNLAKRCGLKVIRLHDPRHSHASLLLKQGIHPKVVQERLGHSTIAITLDTYSHVSPGIQEAAAKRFDEAFTTTYNKIVEKVIG